jgi:hypothetical protein
VVWVPGTEDIREWKRDAKYPRVFVTIQKQKEYSRPMNDTITIRHNLVSFSVIAEPTPLFNLLKVHLCILCTGFPRPPFLLITTTTAQESEMQVFIHFCVRFSWSGPKTGGRASGHKCTGAGRGYPIGPIIGAG